MSFRIASIALIATLGLASARADEVFATFANRGTVVFTRTATGFTGGGKIADFTIGTTVYTNPTLTVSLLTVQGSHPITAGTELSGGKFQIVDAGGATLLSATFDSARLTSNGAWNTAFNASSLEGDNLLFGGLVGKQGNQNGFSFALSPRLGIPNSYDASFAAVGPGVNAVPEPASLATLGLGFVLLAKKTSRAKRGSIAPANFVRS